MTVSSQEADRNTSLRTWFQCTAYTSCVCSSNDRSGFAIGGAFTSHTLTDPSPDADTRTFSFASLQQQSYSPSAVSNRATSTSAPFGAISSTYCWPLPMMPKFWDVVTANLPSKKGEKASEYPLN